MDARKETYGNRRSRIYEYVVKHGPIRPIDLVGLQEKLGCSDRTIRYCLAQLVKEGDLVRYKKFSDMRNSWYEAADLGDTTEIRTQESGVRVPSVAISD